MSHPNKLPAGLKWAGLASLTAGAIVFLGVAQSAPRGPEPKQVSTKFNARLLEIARTYEAFGRVDDEYRWAPYLCRRPNPGGVRFSASADKQTHGQKLYSLFARDRTAYLSRKPAKVGQVLVKQSWVPETIPDKGVQLKPVVKHVKVPVNAGNPSSPFIHESNSFLPYARKDGRLYKAARQADLFIMYKLDPATADTDKGWVYGTVTADGKKVTSAGRVASCMKCHVKTANDRLFGLPKK